MSKPAQESPQFLAVRSTEPCLRVLLSREKSVQLTDVYGRAIPSELETDQIPLAFGLNLVESSRLAATGILIKAPDGRPKINRALAPHLELMDLPTNEAEALNLIEGCRNKRALRIWLEEFKPASDKVRLALEKALAHGGSQVGKNGAPTLNEAG